MDKKCCRCKRNKNIFQYHKNKTKKDGVNSMCKECISEYKKEYGKKNALKIREQNREYVFKRRNENSLLRIKTNLTNLIGDKIRRGGYTKRSKVKTILGCDYSYFKKYISDKFIDGMSWENYGRWHLDHIIPSSSANTEEELLSLNHYSNFQPLWASDNFKKSNKIYS